MPAISKDVFVNRALVGMTMSAANTVTFEQIRFGVGLFQGVALLLHRISYYLEHASWAELVADSDYCSMGITVRDDLSSLTPTNLNLVDVVDMDTCIVGTVVGIDHVVRPIISDFSRMPGGGLLLPANPIYLAMSSAGFAAAGVCRAVLYFTFKQLADKDYLELLQTLVPVNI